MKRKIDIRLKKAPYCEGCSEFKACELWKNPEINEDPEYANKDIVFLGCPSLASCQAAELNFNPANPGIVHYIPAQGVIEDEDFCQNCSKRHFWQPEKLAPGTMVTLSDGTSVAAEYTLVCSSLDTCRIAKANFANLPKT